jgi:hypothetical protein
MDTKKFKTKKFLIQDEQGKFLWGLTSRHGVHFENESMPQFWELNDKTKLFSSIQDANDFATQNNIGYWTKFKIVPVTNILSL